MHDGDWNDGMGYGNWWWIPMTIMMIALWVGAIWLGVTLLNRSRHDNQGQGAGAAPAAARPSAEEILAERLARGEIEPEEYRQRLEALRSPPTS